MSQLASENTNRGFFCCETRRSSGRNRDSIHNINTANSSWPGHYVKRRQDAGVYLCLCILERIFGTVFSRRYSALSTSCVLPVQTSLDSPSNCKGKDRYQSDDHVALVPLISSADIAASRLRRSLQVHDCPALSHPPSALSRLPCRSYRPTSWVCYLALLYSVNPMNKC